jgi:hypothetical protein
MKSIGMKVITLFLIMSVFALIAACSASSGTVKGRETAEDAPPAGNTGTVDRPQTVTVNNPEFMRDVWSNVKDISAANRNFAGASSTAVAGVRGRLSERPERGPRELQREDIERSVAELHKILAEPDLSAVERSCYLYYLGACQMQLGEGKEGRRSLEAARTADPGGMYSRLAAEELSRM